MKSHVRIVLLFAFGISLMATETTFAQSASRGSSTRVMDALPTVEQPQPYQAQPAQIQPAQVQPYQVQPYQGQPNTFVPSGTVASPATIVTTPQSVMSSNSADSFEQKFWNYLVRSKYRNWAPVPGQSDKMYEGESPHGAYLKMYLNRKAAGSPSDLPSGSIVIKENYGKDQRTLMAVTVMYKNNGYSRSTGDWYWVKYNPDGSVAMKDGTKRLAGKVQGCIQCHDGADGNDYVFFND